MMRRARTFLRNHDRGNVAMEFAVLCPVMALLLVGLLQVGTLFHAHATMRSALGEGARFARLFRPTVTGSPWDGPSAPEICSRVTGRINAMGNASITSLTLQRTTNGTANALVLAMDYNIDLDFILFTQSPTLTVSRQVYVRNQPSFGSPAHVCTV